MKSSWESDSTAILRRNLEVARSGKKRFPHRNLHYADNIEPKHFLNLLAKSEVVENREAKRSLSGHHERSLYDTQHLKQQLDEKNKLIAQLSQELAMKRKAPPIQKSSTEATLKSQRKVFGTRPLPPQRPSMPNVLEPPPYTHQVLITRKSPKPLTSDPITGLPRSTHAYRSALKFTGASLAKLPTRPFFN